MIERGFVVAFDFDQAIAVNMQQHPATTMTTAAGAFENGRGVAHGRDNLFSDSSTGT